MKIVKIKYYQIIRLIIYHQSIAVRTVKTPATLTAGTVTASTKKS